MRQTSEQFMEEMLKDNTPLSKADDMMAGFEEKMANMIDQRIDEAFAKFREQTEAAAPLPAEKTQDEKFQEVIDSVDAGKKAPEGAAEE